MKTIGLWLPQYYGDKSQCMFFVNIKPAERACFKAFYLKSGYIEPKDLIKRLQELKPFNNFKLRKYEYPYIDWKKLLFAYKETPFDLMEDLPTGYWIKHIKHSGS